ncbi:hypothetical protein DSO57_1010717 [Entomophthora muscae]|uniref:Uncharacterized protein n=1 Tax=Entomophthora muscae TaxID=34485 RepID=A0ACC2U5X7_9FUNG|nr:hypothetical protein DSO57_1010717 [Entomophthora muscae]
MILTSDKDDSHSVAVSSPPSSEVVKDNVPFLKKESPPPQIPSQGEDKAKIIFVIVNMEDVPVTEITGYYEAVSK